jgi:hypothetical protein
LTFIISCREVSEGRVTFHEVDEDVFGHILEYIYCGEVPDEAPFDVLRDVLVTANMWQIQVGKHFNYTSDCFEYNAFILQDLESTILRHLVRVCSPEKCLKIFLFFHSSADLFKDTMPEGARQNVEKVLVETIRDRGGGIHKYLRDAEYKLHLERIW